MAQDPKYCVCVTFNGYYLVPVPMVSISRTFETDGTGRIIGVTANVKLSGKLVAAGDRTKDRAQLYSELLANSPCLSAGLSSNNGVGISANGSNNLMEEERALRKVFTNSNHLNFETDAPAIFGDLGEYPNVSYNTYAGNANSNRLLIKTGTSVVMDGYAKVVSYSADQTDNNWTQTIDYNIELAVSQPVSLFLNDYTQFLVQSVNDDISIEPIEETNLWNWDDPVLETVFGFNFYKSDYPDSQVLPSVNYPVYASRYKITRTVEAVGKHSFNENDQFGLDNAPVSLTSSDGYNGVLGAPNRTPNMNIAYTNGKMGSAFRNARAYVLQRFRHYPTPFFLRDWAIVNRVKSINSSETNGSFRITETSIAIDPAWHPPWADDWSAEVSVDSSFLTTVRINGTIKGYETLESQTAFEQLRRWDAQPAAGTDNELKNLEPLLAKPLPSRDYTYLSDKFPVVKDNKDNMTPNSLKMGKYQNALRGLHWLKRHLNSSGDQANGNVYYSPIVNRARMFFRRNMSLPTEKEFVHNPYKYLDNNAMIAERRLAANYDSIWNQGGARYATFNPIPVNMTESHRSHAGEIDYSMEFNNRPLNLIPGSVSESLTINDNFPVQEVAEVFVLGRRLGPVLQDLGANTSSTREVTFEVVLPRPPQIAARFIFPQYQYQAAIDLVEQLNPKYMFGAFPYALIKSYTTADSQSYNPLEGRISITKGWKWQRAT